MAKKQKLFIGNHLKTCRCQACRPDLNTPASETDEKEIGEERRGDAFPHRRGSRPKPR